MSRSSVPGYRLTAVRLLVLVALLAGIIGSITAGTPARADDAATESQATTSDAFVETPTAIPTSEPPDGPGDPAPPLAGQERGDGVADWTGGPDPAATEPDPATIEPTATEIVRDDDQPANGPAVEATTEVLTTATSAPTAVAPRTLETGSEAQALGDTGVLVTVNANDASGSPVAGVCMTLLATVLFIWQDSGCTDENGQVLLNPAFAVSGGELFAITLDIPPGYSGDDQIGATILPEQIVQLSVVLQPASPADDTMHAINLEDQSPVGGACWTYHRTGPFAGVPGDLAFGPVCDEDGDGATLVPQVPYGAYCIVVTPPSGFRVAGSDTLCTDPESNRDRTKGFISGSGGSGSVVVTIETAWDTPQAGVCVAAVLALNVFEFVELSSACSGVDGVATVTGLVPGDYKLYVNNHPYYIIPFDPLDFSAPDATPVQLTVEVGHATGETTFEAVAGFGPGIVPGVCWSLTTNDAGKPGAVTVVGPVCDDDGDGSVLVEDVPFGSFCYTVTPPEGWYRPFADNHLCAAEIGAGSWRVGFLLATGPTATPYPTSTPFPTPIPAENEPNGVLRVQNCAYTGFDFDFRLFDLCVPAGAGVRLAVIQGGEQVDTVVTNAGGQITLDLPERSAYRLEYLDGNGAQWVRGPGQEERDRYGSRDNFSFTPAAGIADWTMTVNTSAGSTGGAAALIGGACYRIVDDAGNELLPAACDTDNDGVTVIGTLPAVINFGGFSPYRAEMVSPPPGYDPIAITRTRIGFVRTATPTEWVASFGYLTVQLRVHTVDGSGAPLGGSCYFVANRFQTECDTDNDGTVVFDRIGFGPGQQISVVASAGYSAGYLPTTPSQSFTVGAGPVHNVTFTANPYGADRNDRADVRVSVSVLRPPGSVVHDPYNICFSISPDSGVPSGQLCADTNGVLIYRNLPIGDYTLKLEKNSSLGCQLPQTFPLLPVSVTAGDLGTVIEVPVVFQCPPPPPSAFCGVVRFEVTRSVDIYLGTLTDPETGEVLVDGMQFSEPIPSAMTGDLLLAAVNPRPDRITRETIEPWVLEANEGSIWGNEPDWDGNARQALLDQFAETGPIDAGEPELIKEIDLVGSVGIEELLLTPNDPRLADYPECGPETQSILVEVYHQASVTFYELDATLAQPDGPTPTNTPEPFCSTTVTRSLTAAYGKLLDEDGDPIFTALELSDELPPGLIAAIESGGAPDGVHELIDDWLDPEANDETWGQQPSAGLDPLAALTDALAAAGDDVTIGEPADAGTEEYEFSTYRWLDQSELPAGCFTAASFGLLVPVEQVTVVEVSFTELNAALGGDPPGATATPTRTPGTGEHPAPTPTERPGVTTLPNTGAPAADSGGLPLALLVILSGVAALVYANQRLSRRR